MTPSFVDLTYFHEAAVMQNFSRAARKLGISQPSLSMAITRLEKVFSTPLFIRHHKGVTLTQSGERLLKHVNELLDKWQKTADSIDLLSEEVQGKIAIGCHSSLGPYLSSIINELLEKHPKLEIQFHHDYSSRMTEQVIAGNLDIALVYDPIHHPDLIMKKVRHTEITFWRAIGTHVNPEIIICDQELPQVKALLKEHTKQHKIQRLCHANNFEMVAHLVMSGTGIGIISSCLIEKHYSEKLERVPNTHSFFSEMYMIYRSENKNMRAREVVLAEFKKIIGQEQSKPGLAAA